MSEILAGVSGAPGGAIGPIARYAPPAAENAAPVPADESVEVALEHLEDAQSRVATHLEQVGADLRAQGKAEEAATFDAQTLLARDPAFAGEVEGALRQDGTPVGEAVTRAAEKLASTLSAIEDPYLRARAADVRAAGQQVAAALRGAALEEVVAIPRGAIVAAPELTTAQVVALQKHCAAGLATASGTATGHVAIPRPGAGPPDRGVHWATASLRA